MNASTLAPLQIEFEAPAKEAFAGTWFPVRLRLTCPADAEGSVRVRHVSSANKDLRLDADLFERDVEIRPGETYCCILQALAAQVGVVDLSAIQIQLKDCDDLLPLPQNLLVIRPPFARDIAIRAESICSYEEATKVELTFENLGQATYRKLRVNVLPEGAIHGGKQLAQRPEFGPGAKEVILVAAAPGPIELHLTAVVDDAGVSLSKKVQVIPVQAKPRVPFRFLEPTRLAADEVYLKETGRQGQEQHIKKVRSAYHLQGGQIYQVVIRPQAPDLKDVKLHDVPGRVFVRNSVYDEEEKRWKFDVEIAFNELWSKPERLVYKVETQSGPLTGEIHVVLSPPFGKWLKFAATLGIAATVQGAVGWFRRIVNPESPFEEMFEHLRWPQPVELLLLASIPLVWLALWPLDWLQLRLRE